MNYSVDPTPSVYAQDALRLEYVTVSVGFDDLLDVTLAANHGQADTAIVVTTHDDRKTQSVARKHSAICVPTDLFSKNGRAFNKGAAINAGFSRYQYHGWRMVLDSDIVLPDSFRRVLLNHTHLDRDHLYGAQRVNVIGHDNIAALLRHETNPQHVWNCLVDARHDGQVDPSHCATYADSLNGYLPAGYFQLWHASCQKDYPFSLGTAAHDDIMYAALWPRSQRTLLPTVTVYHLCPEAPRWGQNWEGQRKMPRLS